MHSSPPVRLPNASWFVTLALPVAAWLLAAWFSVRLHGHFEIFFIAATLITAAFGGLRPALTSGAINAFAMLLFSFTAVRAGSGTHWWMDLRAAYSNEISWMLLLIAVAASIGYARTKWWAAELLAGHLNSDLVRLRDDMESQRADLRRLLELSVSLSSSLDLQRLLNNVLTAVAALQKTDLALLLLLPGPGSRHFLVETSAGFTPEQLGQFGEVPLSMFPTRRRLVIESIEKSDRDHPFVDIAARMGIRAIFSSPIINNNDQPLGVVVMFFRRTNLPTERQTKLVELYSRQAANALDNARLYRDSMETLAAEQHRTTVLRLLADASVQFDSVSSLDILLRMISDQARKIVGTRHAFTTLLLRGDWGQTLTSSSVADGHLAMPLPSERSEVFMLACSYNKPVRITSDAHRTHPWKSMMKLGATVPGGWLAAPLLSRDGHNLGLIQLSQKSNGEFTEDDEAILVQLSHMASGAIENVRLYREAQEQLAETQRAREALQRSQENMQLALRRVGTAFFEWDLQSNALTWSGEICRLHGIQPEDFDGRYESWTDSIHPEDRHPVQNSISTALTGNKEYEVQYRVVFPDKSVHWLESRGQTIMMGNTPIRILGVVMDVTSRRLAEESLRRSEKLAATGRLAASIAHEINNPLATIMNALYILRTRGNLQPNMIKHLEEAEDGLGRVVHFTRQTLAFYREIPSPVPTSIPSLVEEVLGAYRQKIEDKAININSRYGTSDEITAFPGELRQVFSNLILNALEAALVAGTIMIRIRQATGPKEKPGIRITVADDGAGISPQNLSRVFEPFFTTKESKGTGLGLWVSLGIVQKHGGTVRIRSSVDEGRRGTCVTVFLPADLSDAPKATEEPVNHMALTTVS